MIKAAILGLGCFLLFLAVHVIVFRALRPRRRFKTITLVFYLFFALYLALYYLLPAPYVITVQSVGPAGILSDAGAEDLTNALVFSSGLVLYVFLFLGYCQFYFIIDRSISVRLMIEIENSPGKKLTYDEMKSIYSFDSILTRRLEHMVEGGYLDSESGYYANTSKGTLEARLFAFLKDLLCIGPGG